MVIKKHPIFFYTKHSSQITFKNKVFSIKTAP